MSKHKEPMNANELMSAMRDMAKDADVHGRGFCCLVKHDDAVVALSIALESVYKRLPWWHRLWLWFKKALAL